MTGFHPLTPSQLLPSAASPRSILAYSYRLLSRSLFQIDDGSPVRLCFRILTHLACSFHALYSIAVLLSYSRTANARQATGSSQSSADCNLRRLCKGGVYLESEHPQSGVNSSAGDVFQTPTWPQTNSTANGFERGAPGR